MLLPHTCCAVLRVLTAASCGCAQVTEHFNVKPGDGFIYFTLKPPWVKTKTVAYTPPTR